MTLFEKEREKKRSLFPFFYLFSSSPCSPELDKCDFIALLTLNKEREAISSHASTILMAQWFAAKGQVDCSFQLLLPLGREGGLAAAQIKHYHFINTSRGENKEERQRA